MEEPRLHIPPEEMSYEEGEYYLTEFDEAVHLEKKVVKRKTYLFEPKQTQEDPSIVGLCYRLNADTKVWEYALVDQDDNFVGEWVRTDLRKVNS